MSHKSVENGASLRTKFSWRRFLRGLRVAGLLALLLPAFQAAALTGAWSGRLQVGQMSLRLVFNFSEDASGNTLCTLDSPQQGAKGIPATVSVCTSDSIRVECRAIGATYSGKIAGGSIAGNFSQRSYSFPLDLKPEQPLEDRRPQTPKPPFPYITTDTAFSAPDGAVMSGTLTMPLNADSRKIPVVLMVTGSGPQNRDEEVFDHRPFAVIADYLARYGIGSLRYDDRGTAKSDGNFAAATTGTFKDDAGAGIKFLRTLPQVGKVGVLGHSEGGTIAFMLGAERKPDFIVSLAGMAISGKETLMMQNRHALDRSGMADADKENSLKLISILFDTMAKQNRHNAVRPIDIDSLVTASGLTVNPEIISSLKMTQTARKPWFDAFLCLNPADYLKRIKCPTLALNGEKDTQVDCAANLAAIRKYAPKADTRQLPGLNHLMQHATTGESSEYAEIRETISPEVLEIITAFIHKASR